MGQEHEGGRERVEVAVELQERWRARGKWQVMSMQPASCQDADNAALGAKSPAASAGTEAGAGSARGSTRLP